MRPACRILAAHQFSAVGPWLQFRLALGGYLPGSQS